jgi:hypothetical protein
MKVEKTVVYRVTVERECGCTAVKEFKDPQYKEAITEAGYEPCKKHKANKDLVDMMGMILKEDVQREAESSARPAYAPMRPVAGQPTSLDGSTGESVTSIPIDRSKLPRAVAAPAAAGAGANVPPATQGPRRDPTQVRTVNRDHASMGRRGASSGRAPVTAVTTTNPAGARPARRAQTVQVGEVELQTPGMDIDIDMDGVPEDPRVTALAENALLPDLEDDPSQV